MNKEDKNVKIIMELKEMADELYKQLPDERKKILDENLIKYGADRILEKLTNMKLQSAALILTSFAHKEPDIILDVLKFANIMNDLVEVFGEQKTADMINKMMPKAVELIEKKINEETRGRKKEKDASEEIMKILKEMGIDADSVEKVAEVVIKDD